MVPFLLQRVLESLLALARLVTIGKKALGTFIIGVMGWYCTIGNGLTATANFQYGMDCLLVTILGVEFGFLYYLCKPTKIKRRISYGFDNLERVDW